MKISFLSFCLVASSLFLFTQCTKDNSSPSTPTSNYSPLTVGSNWTYNYTQDSSAASTYTVTVTSKDTTANGRTYKVLSSSDGTGNLYMAREDSNYYRYASFPQLGIDGFEELYLKDNRPVNSTWTNTASFKYQGTSIPANLTYTIKEKGITHTVNGKTYNDVIHVGLDINVLISSIGGGDFYYAQGIGLIDNQISVGLSGANFNSKQELISYEIK